MTEMMTISTKEVAALMRKDLRERFPHTKFSVRCATGTAAGWIDVSWTDGPVERDVEPLVRSYQSSQFNGMTDSYDQLEDDLISVDPAQMPVLRHYFCCGVNTHREVSPAAHVRVVHEMVRQNPDLGAVLAIEDIDPDTITSRELHNRLRLIPVSSLPDLRYGDRALHTDFGDLGTLLYQAGAVTDLTPEPPGAVKTVNGRTFYRTDPDGTSLVKRAPGTAWEKSTTPVPAEARPVTRAAAAEYTAATGRCLACNRPIRDASKGFGPKCNLRFT